MDEVTSVHDNFFFVMHIGELVLLAILALWIENVARRIEK